MTGKAILLLILGFSTVYAFIGMNLNTVSVNAVDNMVDYYEETVAKNIATTGANMMANKLFIDETYEGELSSESTYGGELEASVTTIDEFTELKVIESHGTINGITKEVRILVRPSKFSKFGYFCQNEPNIWWYGTDTVWGPMHVNSSMKIWGTPVFMGKVTCLNDLVLHNDSWTDPTFRGGLEIGVDKKIPQEGIAKLRDRAEDDGYVFSGHETVQLEFDDDQLKYKFDSDVGGSDQGFPPSVKSGWVSISPLSGVMPGKTVRFVFQHEVFRCDDFNGERVFINVGDGTNTVTLSSCNLDVSIPADADFLEIQISLDRRRYSQLSSSQEGYVKWEFNGGDKVTVCHSGTTKQVTLSSLPGHLDHGDYLGSCSGDDEGWTTVDIEDIAPNGVIYVEGGDIRLKGTLDGRVTVAASRDETSGRGGTVWLDDDIVYKDDPREESGSDDMLGICAQVNVMITDNIPNANDINIDGAIYCESGGFGAENPHSRGFSGDINLLGGITQMERLPVGSTAGDGFWKKYRYDDRLMNASPPAFPGTGGFEVVSWYQ